MLGLTASLPCITLITLLKIYLIASIITAIMFAIDKYLATIYAYRISEKYLILASAACGWPGGLLAMKMVRHKTQKSSFQVMMGLAIIVNIVIVFWLLPLGNCH